MTEPLDRLLEILAAEAEEYRALLPLLQEEERVLLRADIPALVELGARHEALVLRLTTLERRRRAALEGLGVALGVEPATLTVSRVLELVPEPPARLALLRDGLRDLLTRLLVLDGRNRFLAEHALGCLRGLFSSLVSALSPAPGYVQSGRTGEAVPQLQLLDRRA